MIRGISATMRQRKWIRANNEQVVIFCDNLSPCKQKGNHENRKSTRPIISTKFRFQKVGGGQTYQVFRLNQNILMYLLKIVRIC